MAQALIHIGHILGVALAVGSLFLIHYAVLPAGAESLEDRRIPFLMALRRRTHVITLTAVVLIFLTGLLKMTPVSMGFGGVSPLGAGGKYTAVLHLAGRSFLGAGAITLPDTDHWQDLEVRGASVLGRLTRPTRPTQVRLRREDFKWVNVGDDGSFVIRGVPVGTHRLERKPDPIDAVVRVAAGQTTVALREQR